MSVCLEQELVFSANAAGVYTELFLFAAHNSQLPQLDMSESQNENSSEKLDWQEFFEKDRFAVENGCRIVEVHPGYSKIELEITPHHYNATGIVQGGALFTLADFAFAVASNAAGDRVVGTSVYMNFFKATRTGVLTAIGKEISRSRKLSTVEVQIFDEENNLIAQFQGNGYILTPPKQ